MSSNQLAYAQKRRSSRIDKAIPLAVLGLNTSRSPFREEVTTVKISCHGCSCQMKHEVVPGEMVTLETTQNATGKAAASSRARVKWIQRARTAKEDFFVVAVELETAGNIWGIASPPEDWSPWQRAKIIESGHGGRELRVMPRTEPQAPSKQSTNVTQAPQQRRAEAAAPLASSFSELVAGLSEQIQSMASEAAASTLSQEKARLVNEFRTKLQDEALNTLERVIAISKEELTRRALKELNETLEAAARTNHERWIKTIGDDLEKARQRMAIQANEVGQRIDSMTTLALERLQRNLETSRSEAADRLVSRLRDQVAPLLAEAKAALQRLVDSQANFRQESDAIYEQFGSELDNIVLSKLTEAQAEMDKNSSTMVDENHEKLRKLSQSFEKTTREGLQVLVSSSAEEVKNILDQRAAEISATFSNHLEGVTRSYLESISESIAEIPRKIPVPLHG